jgi:hypothetical protein
MVDDFSKHPRRCHYFSKSSVRDANLCVGTGLPKRDPYALSKTRISIKVCYHETRFRTAQTFFPNYNEFVASSSREPLRRLHKRSFTSSIKISSLNSCDGGFWIELFFLVLCMTHLERGLMHQSLHVNGNTLRSSHLHPVRFKCLQLRTPKGWSVCRVSSINHLYLLLEYI